MTAKHAVRVTQEPGVVRLIDDAELVDLSRQGLIHSYEHTERAEAVLGGTLPNVKKWAEPKKGDEKIEAPTAVTDPDGVNPTQKGE